MNDDRIIELEIKTAYQEDLLQELNKIVGRQQQQIERLEATCRLLNERINSLSIEGSGPAGAGRLQNPIMGRIKAA